MRYSSLALVSVLLVACGSAHERPPSAILSSDHDESSAAIVSAGEPEAPAECVRTTCAEQGFTCGTLDDGCGGTEECGTCADELTCSNDAGGSCTSSGPTTCTSESLRFLGSCASQIDGPLFSNGAHCIDYHDGRPNVTTARLEWACACASSVWSPLPCAKRVASGECTIENSGTCSRSGFCFPKK